VARRLVQQLHRDPEAAAHPLTGWSGSHAAGGSPYPVVGGREQESESWRPRGRRRRGEGLLWYGLGISLLPPTRLQLRYALVVLGWDHWPWAGPILSFLEFQAHPTPNISPLYSSVPACSQSQGTIDSGTPAAWPMRSPSPFAYRSSQLAYCWIIRSQLLALHAAAAYGPHPRPECRAAPTAGNPGLHDVFAQPPPTSTARTPQLQQPIIGLPEKRSNCFFLKIWNILKNKKRVYINLKFYVRPLNPVDFYVWSCILEE
jgi:hypothetical protein